VAVGVVGSASLEYGQDEVAAASGDADDGGVVFLSFGSFVLVVGLCVQVVLGCYERGEEQRS